MKVTYLSYFSFQSHTLSKEQLNPLKSMMITDAEYSSIKEWVNKSKLIHSVMNIKATFSELTEVLIKTDSQ